MDTPLDYLPRLPRRKDFRIGCAGAGFIMSDCHLVAYRQAGFHPVAIASRDPGRARAAAERHGIPRVHATYADLLADPDVEVLDVAVPLLAQPVVWVPTHIVDVRGRRDLGFLRGGIPGAGPLSLSQQQAISAATGEHTRAVLDAAEGTLRTHGLPADPPQVRVGEPGREICAIASAVDAHLIVLFASRRVDAGAGPHSVGHTARFVVDHAACPVLLVRGSHVRHQP